MSPLGHPYLGYQNKFSKTEYGPSLLEIVTPECCLIEEGPPDRLLPTLNLTATCPRCTTENREQKLPPSRIMGNRRSCGFTMEHSWVLLLRLGRSTHSHTESSPDFAALIPWKVSTKNHCTHIQTYIHFLLSFLKGFCFFLAYEVQGTFMDIELRLQGGGQGAGLCLEECTGFRLRPTREKILSQVW